MLEDIMLCSQKIFKHKLHLKWIAFEISYYKYRSQITWELVLFIVIFIVFVFIILSLLHVLYSVGYQLYLSNGNLTIINYTLYVILCISSVLLENYSIKTHLLSCF